MYIIKVHEQINKIFSVFYFMGYWHNAPYHFRNWGIKIIHFGIVGCFPISFIVSSCSEDKDEKIYLLVCAIVSINLSIRLFTFAWKKEEIIKLTHQLCAHSVKDNEEFIRINNKINFIMKITLIYFLMTICSALILVPFMPLFWDEKRIPLNGYSPLDWKNSYIAYWITYAFIVYGTALYCTCILCNLIIWYQMISCATKHQTLRNEFQNMFFVRERTTSSNKRKTLVGEKQLFLKELHALIKNHIYLREYEPLRH